MNYNKQTNNSKKIKQVSHATRDAFLARPDSIRNGSG